MIADARASAPILTRMLTARVSISPAVSAGGFSAGNEAHDERQNDRAEDCDNDRIDHAATCGESESRHDKAADQRPDDADHLLRQLFTHTFVIASLSPSVGHRLSIAEKWDNRPEKKFALDSQGSCATRGFLMEA